MKRTTILVAAGFLAAGLSPGQDFTFNPHKVPTGSVVQITAMRPPISLSRAAVLHCSSNSITVGRDKDKFVVASSNVLEFAVLKTPPPPILVTNASGEVVALDPATAGKSTLWARFLSLFKR
jgi:hypothetical protein